MPFKRLAILIIISLLIAALSSLVILMARGYRLNLSQQSIQGTGILAVSSTPSRGLVYLNDVPQDATNTTIRSLPPGEYRLRLEKQGFATWQKKVLIEEEVVTEVDALLLPLFPELKPLTFTSVSTPIASPDGQKIVYVSTGAPDKKGKTSGLWLLDLSERPFNLANEPLALLIDEAGRKYSQMQIEWSWDSKSLLLASAATGEMEKEYWQLDVSTKQLVSVPDVTSLQQAWAEQKQAADEALLKTFDQNEQELIKALENPLWSPDKSKLFYVSREEGSQEQVFTVIDLKPKDLRIREPSLSTALRVPADQITKVQWYPDSQHLIVLSRTPAEDKEAKETGSAKGVIKIVEIDGDNLTQVFTGNLADDILIPSPNGSRLVILTSFNPEIQLFNLYSINLR